MHGGARAAAINAGRNAARSTNTRDKAAVQAWVDGTGSSPGVQSWPSISDYFGVLAHPRDEDENRPREFWECWWMCKYQRGVKKWYRSTFIQVAVALLIFLNFLISAAGAQAHSNLGNPDPDLHGRAGIKFFFACELFFTIIFTVELGINMFAHWWWLFWADGWNWFDFIVVFVSLLSMLLPNLPGVAVLRLLRAFRVFRLFKRMESLRKIIKSLEESIPGVANAFMILMLVMSIYAILGVEFFRHTFIHPWNAIIQPNYFDNFSKSLFTLFQTMTGESWSEAIARPCIRKHPVVGSIYFVSFVLINGFVLVNVAIAVLLEKMMDDAGPPEVVKVWLIVKTGLNQMAEARERFLQRDRGSATQISPQMPEFSDAEQDEARRTVYVSWDGRNMGAGAGMSLEAALADLSAAEPAAESDTLIPSQYFLCHPPPPEEGEEEEPEYADDGTLIEAEVDDDADKLRMVHVVINDGGKEDPVNPNSRNRLIKVVFNREPWVKIPDADKPSGFSQRPAMARDGFMSYQVPPEKLDDMIRRVQRYLVTYTHLMTVALEKLNHRIDRLGMDENAAGGQPPPLTGMEPTDNVLQEPTRRFG